MPGPHEEALHEPVELGAPYGILALAQIQSYSCDSSFKCRMTGTWGGTGEDVAPGGHWLPHQGTGWGNLRLLATCSRHAQPCSSLLPDSCRRVSPADI